jgi:hypothetical protein
MKIITTGIFEISWPISASASASDVVTPITEPLRVQMASCCALISVENGHFSDLIISIIYTVLSNLLYVCKTAILRVKLTL